MPRLLHLLIISVLVLGFCSQLDAAVIGSAKHGFQVQIKKTTTASADEVSRAIVDGIGKWWSPAHTYSGDSKNLYIEAKPKGWFGERLAKGGFVRHMEVVYFAPGKAFEC